jgi:hypothetical protein
MRAFPKKILHIGHILLDFLRHVVKAFGRPDHAVQGMGKVAGKGAAKSAAGKSSAIAGKSSLAGKSSVIAGKLGFTAGGSGAAGASGSGAAGIAGTVVTAKTITAALVASSLLVGGVASYDYVNHADLIGDLFKTHHKVQNTIPPVQQSAQTNGTQTTIQTKSKTITTQTAKSTVKKKTTDPNQYNAKYDAGKSAPSFNYTVPNK